MWKNNHEKKKNWKQNGRFRKHLTFTQNFQALTFTYEIRRTVLGAKNSRYKSKKWMQNEIMNNNKKRRIFRLFLRHNLFSVCCPILPTHILRINILLVNRSKKKRQNESSETHTHKRIHTINLTYLSCSRVLQSLRSIFHQIRCLDWILSNQLMNRSSS